MEPFKINGIKCRRSMHERVYGSHRLCFAMDLVSAHGVEKALLKKRNVRDHQGKKWEGLSKIESLSWA
jgi:hypothetical protein